jgi:glycyl-tRNA synthetase
MIDNKDSNKRYRVDHLIEGFADELKNKGEEVKAQALLDEMEKLLAATDYVAIKKLIEDNNIKCALSKTCNWTEVREFNLMFSTQIGSVAEESDTIYLRPETAQEFL